MKYQIQLVNERGRGLSSLDRKSMPSYHGILGIHEARSHALGRTVPTAYLLSSTDGNESPLLPVLQDAVVLYLRDGTMRIRGFEFIEGVQYGQTWDVRTR